jgi:hypothetical protein
MLVEARMFSKKPIIFGLIIGLIIGLVLLVLQTRNSVYRVEFVLSADEMSVLIYESEDSDNELLSIQEDSVLLMPDGIYYYSAKGSGLSEERVEFSAYEDTRIVVDPSYSEEQLSKMLEEDKNLIHKSLRTELPESFEQFDFSKGRLYLKGDWYGGLLSRRVEDSRQQLDSYRFVARKSYDGWSLVTEPKVLLKSIDYPDLPQEVIVGTNNQVPN